MLGWNVTTVGQYWLYSTWAFGLVWGHSSSGSLRETRKKASGWHFRANPNSSREVPVCGIITWWKNLAIFATFQSCSLPAQMVGWKARGSVLYGEVCGKRNPSKQPCSSTGPPAEGGAKLEKLRSEAKKTTVAVSCLSSQAPLLLLS